MKIKIKPDPCFERIRRTLLLESKPDRPPLCDFEVAPNIMEWVIERELKTVRYASGDKRYECPEVDGQLEFWLKAGYDYVHMRPFYQFCLNDIQTKEGSQNAEGLGIIRDLGILHSRKWPWQKPEDFCYQHIVDMARILPEEMKLIISTGDIFTRTWENMGFVHFCQCLYEDPELIAELFRQLGEAVLLLNERTIELVGDKIGAIWYTDDLAYNTGPLVNPEVYRKYLFPWVKKISAMAESLNVPFLYHTDGKLWEIFPDFLALGVKAIHPLEPKSMEAEEVKEQWGKHFCLIGNIDLDLLSRGCPEEVATLVRNRIEKLGYDGGYCVGSSNTIASYVKPENFKAMVETVFHEGHI
ncbi:MAG TPA: nucleoside 2-deoxyribosyltransferase [Firmicutes bacterium]|mgnify:FL=1|nr:nucleoside 2-deoxyribosyltransferase [Bacillota bacterium]